MLTLNKAKKIVCLLILIMILLPLKTLAVVSQTNEFYVNDYAKILSSETKEYIINTNIELQKKTGAQIVVVTVSSLGGQSIEEYATELFRKFGIGDKNKNNGVLLLCSTGDRLFRIEVGYGLEGRLTDGKTGRIQDKYIIPYLKNDNYNEGIKNGFSAVLKEVCKEHHLKVILETGALKSASNIKKASILSMYSGADFIKTSTGKQQPAATPEAAYVMCEAIKEYYQKTGNKVGFKPAGGINTVNDAVVYYTIVKEVLGEEWLNNQLFRLGTSRLANLLLSDIKGEEIKFF